MEQNKKSDWQKKKAKHSRVQELAESSKRQEEARKVEEEWRLKEIEAQQKVRGGKRREDERERLLREAEIRKAEQAIEDARQKSWMK